VFHVDKAFDLEKDRDYAHGSWADHEFAHPDTPPPIVGDFVYCDIDPVTGKPLNPPEKYYLVTIKIDGKDYIYLVPAANGGLSPSLKQIKDTMNDYNDNRVEGGRDILTYIDPDKTPDNTFRGILSGRT
jgi:hypothetical protein